MKRSWAVGLVIAGAVFTLSAAPALAKDPKVGARQKTESGTVAVLTFEQPAAVATDSYSEPDEGEEFAAIEVKVCNKSDDRKTLLPQQFELQLADQTRVDSEFGEREPALDSSELAKGECVKGWVTFSVPVDGTVKFVRFSGGGPFSSDGAIRRWRVTRDTTVSTTTTLPANLITKAEFDQIQPGMTLDQVNAIIGAPGTLRTESGAGTPYSYAIYEWTGARDSSATVFLRNGVVDSTTQFGLE